MNRSERIARRRFLQLSAAGLAVGGSSLGWMQALADVAGKSKERKRSCILLWMAGGPSQLDTWDPKPGHRNGGPVKAIDTAVPGIQISEYLPELAKQAKNLAIVRSVTSKEGDHGRATYFVRTGNLPQGPLRYPTIGSLISKELDTPDSELPAFFSVAPNRFFNADAFGPGFLGSAYAPLIVGEITSPNPENISQVNLNVENIAIPEGVTKQSFNERLRLRGLINSEFARNRNAAPIQSHEIAYQRAVRLMNSSAVEAFDLEKEKQSVREAYGESYFGQGCLLARRLVEVGVPFVEVSLGPIAGAPAGWDTHQNNFEQVKALSGVLDKAWSQLIKDLSERGLLETTTIVWMGEFGRTPRITNTGRDHHSASWSAVLAGGGIKGGQVIGKTTADGMAVADRPIQVIDLLATVCKAVGVDPNTQNNVGERPIRIVDIAAKPIEEVLV